MCASIAGALFPFAPRHFLPGFRLTWPLFSTLVRRLSLQNRFDQLRESPLSLIVRLPGAEPAVLRATLWFSTSPTFGLPSVSSRFPIRPLNGAVSLLSEAESLLDSLPKRPFFGALRGNTLVISVM